jgi:hypothetical protein
MTKILCALGLLIFSWTTPLPLLAARVVIGYANISARVSPLWIAQEKGFCQIWRRGTARLYARLTRYDCQFVHGANSVGQ